jgi:hypothetical protein
MLFAPWTCASLFNVNRRIEKGSRRTHLTFQPLARCRTNVNAAGNAQQLNYSSLKMRALTPPGNCGGHKMSYDKNSLPVLLRELTNLMQLYIGHGGSASAIAAYLDDCICLVESRNLRGLGKFGCAPNAVRWTGGDYCRRHQSPPPPYGKPWLPDLSAS